VVSSGSLSDQGEEICELFSVDEDRLEGQFFPESLVLTLVSQLGMQ